jgi:hypothetical protein
MNQQIADFVKNWISDNVFNVPGLTDPAPEVAHLAQSLDAATQSAGIPRATIEREMGSFEGFLTEAYENVHDPELGFKD